MVWWAWMLLAWVLVFKIGRRRWRRWGRPPGWGMWMNPYQRAWLLEHNRSRWQYMQSGSQASPAAPPAPESVLSPAQQRERAIAEVRKRYVADQISVEQYEREVDEILAKQP